MRLRVGFILKGDCDKATFPSDFLYTLLAGLASLSHATLHLTLSVGVRNHALWMDDREIPARQTDGASLNARAFSTTSCCRKPAWSRNRPTSLIGRGTRSDVVSVFLLSGDPVALRQVEGGTPPADVCRQLGISEATFYV